MKYPALTDAQVNALGERFGMVLDVEREIRDATHYAEEIHQGPRYKSFSRFVWNWCRRSEEEVLRRRGRRAAAQTGQPRPSRTFCTVGPTAEEVRAIADDPSESEQMRRIARELLAEMEGAKSLDSSGA